jgi:ribosomal protein S18 acetylase RimI-like enzyme
VSTLQSAAALFATGTLRAVVLTDEHVPALQRFFERNPEYFIAVNGQPPERDEAHAALHATLPEGWSFAWKRIIGFVDPAGSLVGMGDVVADLMAPGVWHIGLFIVSTARHGSGVAQTLYQQLERFASDSGARWLRLGVVRGNARAERFWERCGFVEVRMRRAVAMGKRVNDLRVMAKPLAGGTLGEYLSLVPRDRPGS